MKYSYYLILLLALFAGTHGQAKMQLVTGIEDFIREIEGNPDQVWLGLEYSMEYRIGDLFAPYAKGMVGLGSGDDYLLAAGLAYDWQPFEKVTGFSIALQTGPSYTNVGVPHSGSHLNWTTELAIHYKYLMLGYSHTSNGGIYSPNSGLDMFLVAFTLP